MQLFNLESHAIGIKPVHGIDDAIPNTVLTSLSKEMGMYMSLIILTQNGTYNFSCDNIALDSKIFTFQCTEMMAW